MHSGERGQPGTWGQGEAARSHLPRPSWCRENGGSGAPGPQEQQTHLVPALSRCVHADSGVGSRRLLVGLPWACAKGQWGCHAWPRARSPPLSRQRGCVGTWHPHVGPVPQLWKRASLPLSSGLACSFTWGSLPWAWCPDPKEAPAFPAPYCLCSLLPSWPCCQRPLVPGWLCMRARASETRRASEVSHQLLRLLPGKKGMEGLSRSLRLPYRNPGSSLGFPVLTLSWHSGLDSQMRVRQGDESPREPCFLSTSR